MGSIDFGSWLIKHEALFRVLFLLFLGQAISFIMAICGFSSSYLASVDAPITQSFFTYLSLTVVYGGIMLFRRQKLLIPWYYYALLGFVDVQGNYLVNKAFQFSSITSVAILDCWTIPWVIILTSVFIGTRYSIWQYIGAATCITGLGLVLFSDAGVGGGGGSRPILGDFLVISGTLFYAFSNVGEKDVVEVTSMIGVFELLVSMCEIFILERRNLEAIEWSKDVILGFAGFAASMFLFYTLLPFILKVDWLYYVSFGTVVLGLVIYSKSEKNPIPIRSVVEGQYQILDEESRETVDDVNKPLIT